MDGRDMVVRDEAGRRWPHRPVKVRPLNAISVP